MALRQILMLALLAPVALGGAADASTFTNQSTSLRGSLAAAASCTASWAYNCKDTMTCCEAGFTCFQKTPNWAACLISCTPGVVQPGDHGKQIPWTCNVLGGSPVPAPPAPAPTPSPSEPCVDENESCSGWAGIGECSANPSWMLVHCQRSCGQC
mmetsp:Transcript_11914/g.24698  ORF Transcript_11914/g.24698 Transcript_11914/m.24698 type:complete len:155 (-) Transcript_11914:367-831(-)